MQEQMQHLDIERAEHAERRRGQRTGVLYQRGEWWFLSYRDYSKYRTNKKGELVPERPTVRIGPCRGIGKMTEKQAQRIAWDLYLSKVDLAYLGQASRETVKEFVEKKFEPDCVWTLKPSGKSHYRHLLKNHVLPALGVFELREVNLSIVQDLLRAKVNDGLSVQTVVHVKNAISAVFRHAKRLKAFSGDLPTEGVRLPPLVHAEKQALTLPQVEALAAWIGRPDETKERRKHSSAPDLARVEFATQQLSALVIILAHTGLRIGEAMGLRWKRVNLTDQPAIVDGESVPAYTLAVRENFVRGQYGTLKSRSSRRNIPLSSEVWYQFSRLQAAAASAAPDAPVFAGRESGKPLEAHNIASRFLKPAAKRAGCPWVSWHILRHTAATLADQVGLSVSERQRVLGHAAGSMTLHYTHAEIEQMRGRMEKIGTKPTETVH